MNKTDTVNRQIGVDVGDGESKTYVVKWNYGIGPIEIMEIKQRKHVDSKIVEPKALPAPSVGEKVEPKDDDDLCNGCLLQGDKCVNCGTLPDDYQPFLFRPLY